MSTRYVKTKTARLYEGSTGEKYHMVLIFGDEVDVTGSTQSGRRKTTFRGRSGWLRTNQFHTKPALQVYFLDVGQGDAAFIVTPAGKNILVDGGKDHRAIGFLIWKYRLDDPANSVDIDMLVLSHADQDHIKGLIPIVQHPRIRVHEIIHNGMAMFASGYDHPSGDVVGDHLITWHDSMADLAGEDLATDFENWRNAVLDEGVDSYRAVDTTAGTLDVGDPALSIEILAPHYEILSDGSYALLWLDDHAHTINGHSVAFRIDYDEVSFLFSGDLNIQGSEYLLAQSGWKEKLQAHVLKSPHHGSHEYHAPFFEAVRPQISVVSSGDSPDYGHPRAEFLGAIGLVGRSKTPLIFSTEIAATFVDSGEELEVIDSDLDGIDDFSTAESNLVARKLFKQSLPGIINVRSDGKDIYAARRVSAGYWWEAYGPIKPQPFPTVLPA